jgi:hypothetical protein
MNKFVFKTDNEAEEFCMSIVDEMKKLFNITEEEAIGRINDFWSHLEGFQGENMLIYHETEEFWAKEICYGHASKWWAKEGKEELKLIPYK